MRLDESDYDGLGYWLRVDVSFSTLETALQRNEIVFIMEERLSIAYLLRLGRE